MAFHMSAYRATVRSVFFSPLPPIMMRQALLDGERLVAKVIEVVVATGLGGHGAAVEHSPHGGTDSSSQSNRWPNPLRSRSVSLVLELHPRPTDPEDGPPP